MIPMFGKTVECRVAKADVAQIYRLGATSLTLVAAQEHVRVVTWRPI